MELVSLASAVYAARGTEQYECLLNQLPPDYRDMYHKLIAMGAQYTITMFFAQRGQESMVQMDIGDLVEETDETLQFTYWREVRLLCAETDYSIWLHLIRVSAGQTRWIQEPLRRPRELPQRRRHPQPQPDARCPHLQPLHGGEDLHGDARPQGALQAHDASQGVGALR